MLDVNHCISKTMVSKPFDVFAVEQLRGFRKKGNGRRFNSKLGSWSFAQLRCFLEYKAEQAGKTVVSVSPRYTSQTCSRCGCTDGANREGPWFRCGQCGFQLDADLNASRNIGMRGMSEYLRLFVNEPNVASDEPMSTDMVDDSSKPTLFRGGVDIEDIHLLKRTLWRIS